MKQNTYLQLTQMKK